MSEAPIDDPLLDAVLAGTPDRVLDVVVRDPRALAEIAAIRETLTSLCEAVIPVEPPPTLRERVEAAIRVEKRQAPKSALIIMDMIVDYLTPGRPLEVPRARNIVPAVRARIDDARRNREPVIFLLDSHEPDDPELLTWPAHAVRDTEGSAVWPELGARIDDVIVRHRTYSGFFDTDLDAILRSLAVDTLVFTGCATEIGIFATATDALMRGYEVIVPPECQAGASEPTEQAALAALHVMRPLRPMPTRSTNE